MGIAFIDTAAHPIAEKYYALMKTEPIRVAHNVVIWDGFQRKPIPLKKMTLRSLLASMVGSVAPGFTSGGLTYPGDSILICCHGTTRQLAIPVATGGCNVYTDSIKLIDQKDETPEAIKETAGRLFIDAPTLTAIRKDLAKVRDLKIGHVAFRSCNIGNSAPLLASLKKLFNTNSISAPKVYDGYNYFNPDVAKNDTEFEQFVKKHPNCKVDGPPSDQMAVVTSQGSSSGKWKIKGLAQSEYAIYLWYLRKFPMSDVMPKKGQELPIHAMIMDKVGYEAVFPGDKDYMDYIIYWTKNNADWTDSL